MLLINYLLSQLLLLISFSTLFIIIIITITNIIFDIIYLRNTIVESWFKWLTNINNIDTNLYEIIKNSHMKKILKFFNIFKIRYIYN